MTMRDTIFALSSGHPPAGVAVIRLSGPAVRFGLETAIGRVPEPRKAVLTEIRNQSGDLIDDGLALYFPAPKSFTGEDVAEFQVHGSRASVAAVLGMLGDIEGFRPAEPGEFTRRAFENGRMDLTEVEGLSDLIRAETEEQRRLALSQSGGSLREVYEGWARRLTHARAMIEAELDFSDEEDIPGAVSDNIWPDLNQLSDEIDAHLSRARVGEIIRDGFRITLLGAPNAGKSSLLNALAQRDVAIVSDVPGTTRDVIETRLDLDGYVVVLQDTAGLRQSDSPVEAEGIRRSLQSARTADLILELRDVNSLDRSGLALDEVDAERVIVWTKADLHDEKLRTETGGIWISSKTGFGMAELLEGISSRLSALDFGRDGSVPTRERHVVLIKQCLTALGLAVEDTRAPIEVRSEHLRFAAESLSRITGRVDVEDLLGVVFSEFCVGK